CHDRTCWEPVMAPGLAERGIASIRLDLTGHGGSAGSVRGAHLRHYVADIRAVIVAEGLPPERVVLLGHSLGGVVVQLYLERYAARAGVLFSTSVPHATFPLLTRSQGQLRRFGTVRLRDITSLRQPFTDVPEVLVGAEATFTQRREVVDALTDELS